MAFDKGWTLQGVVGSGSDNLQSTGTLKKLQAIIRQGCGVSMATGGPLLRSRVVGADVQINRVGQLPSAKSDVETDLMRLQVPTGLALSAFSALLRSAVMKATRDAIESLPVWKVMEPVMAVEIYVPLDNGRSSRSACFLLFTRGVLRTHL